MVNLTYVGLLQGMFKKFSFAVTCLLTGKMAESSLN